MFFKGCADIKYVFSTIKSSFLPAFVLLSCLVAFYLSAPYDDAAIVALHCLFLTLSAAAGLILYFANRSKPLFSLMLGVASYIIVCRLRAVHGENFINCDDFRCLSFMLPLDFVLLYFLPQSRLRSARNFYLLLFLLLQGVFVQHCGESVNLIPYADITAESLPLWACMLWTVLLVPPAISVSLKPSVVNTGLFYADSCLFMGMVYADSPAGLTTFFSGFALIILFTAALDLYRRYRFDDLDHVGSRAAYLSDAVSKFPFKYTVALFCIDNRDKLQTAIGTGRVKRIEQLVVDSILEMPYELSLYRYTESELIMVFKNEDARHVKEFAENIRHNIAAADFILSDGTNCKITISACVSEKTRKDRDAAEVPERAHAALTTNYRFNTNIVTTA